MATDRKPTQEELDEQINQALEEDTPETPEEDAPASIEIPEDEDDQEDQEEQEEESEENNVIHAEKKDKKIDKEDITKRYRDSSREGIKLYRKNRNMSKAIEEAEKIPEPTQEELEQEYPEWETMSDTEQKMARQNLMNDKRFKKISEATQEFREIDRWEEKVDDFIKDPVTLNDYPELEGKEEEFINFATDDKRRNANFDLLVESYLYNKSRTAKPSNKGSMMESGTGGSNEKPTKKPGTYTVEEAEAIKKSNYKKYTELLRAGKIKFSDIE